MAPTSQKQSKAGVGSVPCYDYSLSYERLEPRPHLSSPIALILCFTVISAFFLKQNRTDSPE